VAGGGAAADVGDEPHPVGDREPLADAVPCHRVVGVIGEHLRAGRVGDAADGQGDATLVDRVIPGTVGFGPGLGHRGRLLSGGRRVVGWPARRDGRSAVTWRRQDQVAGPHMRHGDKRLVSHPVRLRELAQPGLGKAVPVCLLDVGEEPGVRVAAGRQREPVPGERGPVRVAEFGAALRQERAEQLAAVGWCPFNGSRLAG
jgi:hypothetical protein